ncbi:sensor histidine kinase RegB [Jannaschia sp. LMIT008]|uniref:sensor histidine kinase RegB n=1 Tax=Jannaschia maritima TaxID=3032585 RepID=UPI002811A54B|nr:ActS/PrrB/RegB family redox-sensitive histidine kinase [Jannaschia sp. LMIT008]
MPERLSESLLPPGHDRNHIRLQTLVNVRWAAVIGQTVTVLTAWLVLGLDLPLMGCFAIIAAMVAANLWAQLRNAPGYRLPQREAIVFLAFDIAQLAALLYLTGGLNNPFAILIVGPVTISATSLSLRATLVLAGFALALTSLLGGYHVPLHADGGPDLNLPRLHLMGFWAAIVVATLLLATFALRLTQETQRMSNALVATQTALAREQKLHDLGGVVAAAAHELGTPLATIKLVSAELEDELGDRPEQAADAALIRQQADRCRDILRSMGQAGKDDLHLHAAPFQTVVAEAAEPHAGRAAAILYDFAPEQGADPARPRIRRAPETIHALRNLIQNAVDFAAQSVWIVGRWDDDEIRLSITDDGPGYPPEMLRHLGDPFLRTRPDGRTGYAGMGLGLFISKTLLERTGARIAFANGAGRPGRRGAVVEIAWPRERIEDTDTSLGENKPLIALGAR